MHVPLRSYNTYVCAGWTELWNAFRYCVCCGVSVSVCGTGSDTEPYVGVVPSVRWVKGLLPHSICTSLTVC